MGIIDKLKGTPKWKNADPVVRLEGLREVDDPAVFAEVLDTDADAKVRRAAVGKVEDPASLTRAAIEKQFPLLWVSGEISNLVQAASGHVYFSLKDAQAQVRCAMFRSRAQLASWKLENGQQVEVQALVTLYEARGEFQLTVETLVKGGLGTLYERFLELKAARPAGSCSDPSGWWPRESCRLPRRGHGGGPGPRRHRCRA